MSQTTRPTIGQYTLGERIGRDDLGDVYRAYHRRHIGREVALRTISPQLSADPAFIQRFDLGLDTLASLIHPQIAPILGHGDEDGVYCLITPLVKTGSLQDRLARGPLAPPDLLASLWPIAEALDYAHSRGIGHGDLRPTNVRLDGQGNPTLTDFGIAKLVESSAGVARSLTPQQRDDLRGDIYDLGRIAYLGLTGYEPGGSATLAAALVTWPAAERVFRRALATSPADRYPTAGEFVRELAAALGTNIEEQRVIEEVNVALDAADADDARVEAAAPEDSATAARPSPPFPRPKTTSLAGILPQSAAGRQVFFVWLAAIVLLGVVLGGALIVLGGRGSKAKPQVAAVAPTPIPAATKVAAQALAPAADLPYQFPVNDALIARKYAEAQSHLPAAIKGSTQLNRFAAECADPRNGGDCLLVFVFYSKQTDLMYNYHFKVLEDALIGDFTEPALNDDYRVVFKELPWVHNPNWTNLLRESYAQLPANYAPAGYTAALVSNSAAFNAGTTDWTIVYFEPATKEQQIFELSGETIVKLPQ